MTQQAGAEPAIQHDRPAAGRVASGPGQRGGDRVADDRVGAQGSALRRRRRSTPTAPPRRRRRLQPKVSAVIVRNQASRIIRLESAKIGRRIDRADPARTVDIGQLPVRRMVDAGDRDPVIRRDQAVAGVDQLWRRRRFAVQQRGDRVGADLGLGIGGEGRFRHRAGDRGIADDMDVRLQTRFEGDRIDRAPAGAVGDTGEFGDASGSLRRDDIGDVGLVGGEIGHERAGRRHRPR